jgi:FKBP-type peptidyl-prolyl cis-trans isomerase
VAIDEKPQVVVPSDQAPSYQLEIEDIVVGDGDEAVSGRVVEVHYVGVSWKTGQQFDASWDRGSTFKFGLGKGQVIAGWDQGVAGNEGRRSSADHDPADAGVRQARRWPGDRTGRDPRLRRGPNQCSLTRRSWAKIRPGANATSAGRRRRSKPTLEVDARSLLPTAPRECRLSIRAAT